MQLHDYYKKYGATFLESFEFMNAWGGTVPFKLMDNRVCASPSYVRKCVTERLNSMFTIDSVPDAVHHKILTLYFEALIEFNIIPAETEFKQHLNFDSDKVRIFNKGFLNFRRPTTLDFPTIYEKPKLVDRVIFNGSIFVDENRQYNFYTVMSNYGHGSIDNEFMKFSYYVHDGMFHFQPPKSSDKMQVLVSVPLDEIEQHYEHFKRLIKKRLFSSFYEDVSRVVFRRVLNFETFNDTHLKVLLLLAGTPLKPFMTFMEEYEYINNILLLSEQEVLELYSVSLTTFEMMKI